MDHKTSQEALKELAKTPNYDPICIGQMHDFQQRLLVARPVLAEELVTMLVRLRELWLEMSPLQTHQYDERYAAVQFRLGDVPLNLHNYGDRPLRGEIAADVAAYVEERAVLFEEAQGELRAQRESDQLETARLLQQDEKAHQQLHTQCVLRSHFRARFACADSAPCPAGTRSKRSRLMSCSSC